MLIETATACVISFSMTCMGVTLTTPSYWDLDKGAREASLDLKTLTQHMMGRVWGNKGPLPPNATAKYTCTNAWVRQFCANQLEAAITLDTFQPDALEITLIQRIWGPMLNNTNPFP